MSERPINGGLRGSALLRAVYAELYLSLGELYSPKDLLIAAQKLIQISGEEYSDRTFQDEVHFSGYYTRDVDFMIKHRPWSIVEYEVGAVEFEEEERFSRFHSENRLKYYHNPDRYYHRG